MLAPHGLRQRFHQNFPQSVVRRAPDAIQQPELCAVRPLRCGTEYNLVFDPSIRIVQLENERVTSWNIWSKVTVTGFNPAVICTYVLSASRTGFDAVSFWPSAAERAVSAFWENFLSEAGRIVGPSATTRNVSRQETTIISRKCRVSHAAYAYF